MNQWSSSIASRHEVWHVVVPKVPTLYHWAFWDCIKIVCTLDLKSDILNVGSEVFTAEVMNSYIFWDITPCSPSRVKWRLGETLPPPSSASNSSLFSGFASCCAYYNNIQWKYHLSQSNYACSLYYLHCTTCFGLHAGHLQVLFDNITCSAVLIIKRTRIVWLWKVVLSLNVK
jgi:hypothetical protein